jgi:O-antigen/teichoic acid export membrane protein
MSDVIAASFPHIEGEKRKAALVRSCTMISMIMFPLAFGLSVVAPTVTRALFDERWASVGSMLIFLAVLSASRPIADILISYFYACERPRVAVWLEWLSLVALIAAISTVGRLGIHWTCTAVAGVFVLRTVAAMWAARRFDGVPLARFLIPMARPLVACLAMALAVVGTRPALLSLSPGTQLVLEVALGAITYFGVVLIVARSASREVLALVRSVVSRR